MDGITLQQLQCFDALVAEGSFQAAAARLLRTHPTVAVAIKNLEEQLGFALLDRSGYRVTLTERGRAFHTQVQRLLQQTDGLKTFGRQLAMGEETALNVAIGDLCPLEPTLGLLRDFFKHNPATRLDLYFEAISGPWERLADGAADLILHHVDKSDPSLDYIDLAEVRLVPVASPALFPGLKAKGFTPAVLQGAVQCVIRDTARHSAPKDYYMLPGARQMTVSDQLMKKQVILNAMGWGHMPAFIVTEEIRRGTLIDFTNAHFRGGRIELVAARRRDRPHGPAASRLWDYIASQTRTLSSAAASKPKTAKRKR